MSDKIVLAIAAVLIMWGFAWGDEARISRVSVTG